VNSDAGDDILAAERIRDRLSPGVGARLRELTVLRQTDSTNAELARLPAGRRHIHAVLADAQTGGRGRRQRRWHSPAGGNIYLSLGWSFAEHPAPLTTLPLIAAVCACRALERAGLRGHGIKWPNDILVGGAKLAGILVESQSTGGGPVTAVIGIGVNVHMPSSGAAAAIDRPWTDLASQMAPGECIGRNELAALLLEELVMGLVRFEAEGFVPFRSAWVERDLVSGKRIRLEGNGGYDAGLALGIDDSGGLQVDIDGYGPQVLHSAEVSVRDE